MAAELEYYKEHAAHGRHVDLQRSAVAGLTATLSGGLVGELLKQGALTRSQLPYSVALFALGFVSFLLSAKLYERFRLHNAIAREARNRLDPSLAALRSTVEREHKKEFPFLYELPFHLVWNSLFALMGLVGLVTSVLILFKAHS